jgi:hypothetical protein
MAVFRGEIGCVIVEAKGCATGCFFGPYYRDPEKKLETSVMTIEKCPVHL